jgi:hypothetical protein
MIPHSRKQIRSDATLHRPCRSLSPKIEEEILYQLVRTRRIADVTRCKRNQRRMESSVHRLERFQAVRAYTFDDVGRQIAMERDVAGEMQSDDPG